MKKLIYIVLLFLFLIPVMVYAEEKDIIVSDLVLKEVNGDTKILSDAELVDGKIELNVKMFEIEDSIEYQFTIENHSSKDFFIDINNLNEENSSIQYTLETKDHSYKVEKNSSKTYQLTATYLNEVERSSFRGGKFDASRRIVLNVHTEILNPITGNIFYTIIYLIIVISLLFLIKAKNKKVVAAILLLSIIMPTTVSADNYYIDLDSNIFIGYVKPNPCTYDGELVQDVEFTKEQYTYYYIEGDDGWGVYLTDKESTDPVTSTLCTSINDKPIVSTRSMFFNSHASSIDTSSFDTSNVTNMAYMFNNMSELTEIDVLNIDTSNVRLMNSMFSGTANLTTLDLSGFDTHNVTVMNYLATGITNLESINLSNIDFTCFGEQPNLINNIITTGNKVKSINMSNAILPKNCRSAISSGLYSLEELILDGVDTSNVTNMSSMFLGLSNIETLNLSSFDTSKVTDMSSMFQNCFKLKNIDLSSFDTSNVTNIGAMFFHCDVIEKIDISNFDTSKVTLINMLFQDCYQMKEINMSGVDFSKANGVSVFLNCEKIKKADLSNMILPPNCSSLFARCYDLEEVILDNVDTSNVLYMNAMFQSCGLTSIDLSGFDTSKVKEMSTMFGSCSHLVSINLNGWDLTSLTSTTSISALFVGDYNLKTIEAKNWIIPADFSNVFYRKSVLSATAVEEIDVTGWDLSNTTNISGLFAGGTTIKTIKGLDTWDVSNITNMAELFSGETALESLDLSSFDMSGVESTDDMFKDCTAVTTAYARTNADATILNNTTNKPSGLTFAVKV